MRKPLSYLCLASLLACTNPQPKGKKSPETEDASTQTSQDITPQGPPAFARLGRFELKGWEMLYMTNAAVSDLIKKGASKEDIEKLMDQIRQQAKSVALENFITDAILAREAERRGEKVTPEEIAAAKEKEYKKQRPPKDTPEADILARTELGLLSLRMGKLLTEGIRVTDEDARKFYQDALTSLEVQYVVFSPPQEPPQEEIAAYAKEHAAEVKAYYDSHSADFIAPEAVRARHILIKVKPSASEKESNEALLKLETASARISAGEKFETVAKEISEDTFSKENGGDLGWLSRGQMLKKFDDVAFSMTVGQISKPVRTPLGFHLINIQEKRPAAPRALAEVEQEIAKTLLRTEAGKKAAQAKAQEVIEQLKAGKKLAEIAAAATPALAVATTGHFSQMEKVVPGLGTDPVLVEAVKGLTMEKPYPDAPLTLGESFVVPVLLEKKDPDMAEFEPQKEQAKGYLLQRRKAEKLQEWLKEARQQEAPYIEVNKAEFPDWKE